MSVLIERAAHAACLRSLQLGEGEEEASELALADNVHQLARDAQTGEGHDTASRAMRIKSADVEAAVRGHVPASFWQLQQSRGAGAAGGQEGALGLQVSCSCFRFRLSCVHPPAPVSEQLIKVLRD